jgi:hypothetical protein
MYAVTGPWSKKKKKFCNHCSTVISKNSLERPKRKFVRTISGVPSPCRLRCCGVPPRPPTVQERNTQVFPCCIIWGGQVGYVYVI